jgi:hypothetical protein
LVGKSSLDDFSTDFCSWLTWIRWEKDFRRWWSPAMMHHGSQFLDARRPWVRHKPPWLIINPIISSATANESPGSCVDCLLAVHCRCQTHHLCDWMALGQPFGVTVSPAVAIAQFFSCFGFPPLAPVSLDHQRISASHKLVNSVSYNRQEWRRWEAHLLGGVCMHCTYQILIKLPWAVRIPANRPH